MDMFPSELAGGEQQKVSLARALASGARLLLLDEPLSALDARVRVELRYELRRLAKGLGLTVVHVTHDQEEAMAVSDRIVLMRNGQIMETSTPKDLYSEPRSLFAANFVGETSLLEGTVVETGQVTRIRLRDGSILGIHRSDFNVGDAVVMSVRPENVYPSQRGLRGKVTDITFMGTYIRITSVLGSGDTLEFDVPETEKIYNEGDDVWLELNKETAQVFGYPSEGIMEVIKLE